jgi:hypothetical protein
VMDQSVVVVGEPQDMSISEDSSVPPDDLPPRDTMLDSPRTLETRSDKRSFLRRTFSVKKLKPDTLTASKDPRLAFLRV